MDKGQEIMMAAKNITKILIANRGEIACRIITTCKRMGIRTVGIYAVEEKELPHAIYPDESYELQGNSLSETYLNAKQIIEIARKSAADAIHPGYGFLSENAEFAKMVKEAGIIFIGPTAENILLMGDKKRARLKAKELGLPVVPGFDGEAQDHKTLLQEAKKIGFPVLIKASAGGGGKGMKVAESEATFETMLSLAKSEAKSSFGDDRMILEKYLSEPRHIEVQVFSDSHGNHLHLFERDCSIQRRHQKIIEETPAPNISDEVRRKICETAVKLTSGMGYLGAGTLEMIMDSGGDFYFLEMNTRLQVEHPVTEMITGLDLVQLQINVAEGKLLPFKQSEITTCGAAIEARIYAEDAASGFLPTSGLLESVYIPHHPNIRFDSGYVTGNKISVSFDPMIAKLIAWGETRSEAISTLRTALMQTSIGGVITNTSFLAEVLGNKAFKDGKVSTHFIEHNKTSLLKNDFDKSHAPIAAAAYFLFKNRCFTGISKSNTESEHSAWNNPKLNSYRNC